MELDAGRGVENTGCLSATVLGLSLLVEGRGLDCVWKVGHQEMGRPRSMRSPLCTASLQ